MNKNIAKIEMVMLLLVVSLVSFNVSADESAKKCRYVRTAQLQVTTLYNQPLIEGSVNGLKTPFLLDTGMYKTHISYDFAEKNGLKLSYLNRNMVGIGGISQTFTTRIDEFSVGIIKGKKMTILVDSTAGKSALHGGWIGADFLFQSDLELSFSENLIRFFQPIDCENKFLAYWDGDITTLDLEMQDIRDGRPKFTVLINGHKVQAILDTGATFTVIDQATAKKVGMVRLDDGPKIAVEAGGIGKRKMKFWLERFDSLRIGDELIPNAAIAVGDMWGNSQLDHVSADYASSVKDEAQLILGMDYLKEHRVLFAISQRKLYISYLGGPLFTAAPK